MVHLEVLEFRFLDVGRLVALPAVREDDGAGSNVVLDGLKGVSKGLYL
jgi:hypothetical protein